MAFSMDSLCSPGLGERKGNKSEGMKKEEVSKLQLRTIKPLFSEKPSASFCAAEAS